nr:hypothetical protein [Tanacetum cinerariifolium]
MKKRPQTEAQARRNMITYLKNTARFRLDYFNGMSYDVIRPIFEAKFNENMEFLLKSKEQTEEEANRALKSINETNSESSKAKKATQLARKVPVVDYQIIDLNNKPRYKIIRADETHQLYPDQGKLTSIVMKDNLAEPRVHVPNVLATHPTLMLDSDFIPSDKPLPESKIFYFDIEEKNSGSTTIHADISLPDLECFNFNSKPDLGDLISIVDSEICENVLSATNVNLPSEEDHSPLFAYVVWIFLSFLTYHVVPLNLLSSGNKDTIFDPGISNYHFPSLLPNVSHWCETFIKFNVYPKLLNESPMEILSST